jgi:hypothetical protein
MNTDHSVSFFDFFSVPAVSQPNASRYVAEMREKEVDQCINWVRLSKKMDF